ncbi:hypothetical protein ACLKA7_001335 [Drosophila subpalustris]
MCGRKFFDGSGGNDHAVEHLRQTGYPLAVELGTISANDKSDVFLYPEDYMVLDANLAEHSSHFGINMAAMRNYEKSMVKLKLEINQHIGDLSVLTESELQSLAGHGYTGMGNFGNSYYITIVKRTSVATTTAAVATSNYRDQCGSEYKLVAFISHMGASAHMQAGRVGHF